MGVWGAAGGKGIAMWVRVKVKKRACALVLPFPLPFPFPLPQWQMPPVAAFVFLDFASPFAFFFPFAFAFAEEVFIEIRRRTPLRTDAFLSACGGADEPVIAFAISCCLAGSAVAIIAMLCLRHFFGGSIGEEGCRSSILLNIAGSPSSFTSMKSAGWSDRSTVSRTNASVAAPGGNDGKPRRAPCCAASSSIICVVSLLPKRRSLLGSPVNATMADVSCSSPLLPSAVVGTCGQEHVLVVGCGSIFTGEDSIFTTGIPETVRPFFGVPFFGVPPRVGVPAGRLRLGVSASDKNLDLPPPSSAGTSASMESGVGCLEGGAVSFASTLVNSCKTESHAAISCADASLEALSLIVKGY